MPHRSHNSRISSLLSGKTKRRPRDYMLQVCPSCGEPLAATDHAVFMSGSAYHAGCVLYQRRVRAGT
jgi:hypothetical protein